MKRLQPYFALSLCALFFLSGTPVASTQKKLKKMKILGYITEFHSPTSFEIEDYRITRDEPVVLEFENPSPEVALLKKNEESFQHIARLVKEAAEKKRKIKSCSDGDYASRFSLRNGVKKV